MLYCVFTYFRRIPRRFIKFNVLYKGRRDSVAGDARHFIPLNFRDKDSPAGNDGRASVPFRVSPCFYFREHPE